MIVTTGKVSGGSIEVEDSGLPEGAKVTILAPEDGETIEIGPDDETVLLAAISEAERGELVSAAELLDRIRKS